MPWDSPAFTGLLLSGAKAEPSGSLEQPGCALRERHQSQLSIRKVQS